MDRDIPSYIRSLCPMLAALALVANPLAAQQWNLPAGLGKSITSHSEGIVSIGMESRGRYESRSGTNFGREPDLSTALYRNRLSATFKPLDWLKIGGMLQDSRAPGYGPDAPSSLRDAADLQEAYAEFLPDPKSGFGMTLGRMMLNYGEARLIGSPQWGNLARTWDHARAYYRSGSARFEVLFLSPVKIRIGEFNRPVVGDRIWGTYNSFSNFAGKHGADIYILRHDQNRPAGFSGGKAVEGTDRLGTTTYGGRLTGPFGSGWKYSLEIALQGGNVGPAQHRAMAWFSCVSRRWTPGKRTLDVSAEYKYASGTDDPADSTRSGAFDQLYPANHDKFGHQDLFGWRNLHNVRSLATLAVTKKLGLNLVYTDSWLASARDALYNGAGRAIARSATGAAGRHAGREADVFATYKHGPLQFGAGYGHFFAGGFVRRTTPGVGPGYVYIFHNYSL